MLKNLFKLLAIGLLVIVIASLVKFNSRPPVGKCTRTERYKNLPEFDRALSLIEQRLNKFDPVFAEGGKGRSQIGNIFNCIKVEYANEGALSGTEGVFLFDPKNARSNFLPIFVSRNYQSSDDLLTSVLLFHELWHGVSYLTKIQGLNSISCIDEEVLAFTMQRLYFTSMLNQGERNSVIARILQGDEHPQLAMLKDLFGMRTLAETLCVRERNTSSECVMKKEDELVKKWVESNPAYQKQCKLSSN